MTQMEEVLANIEDRDNNIYRLYFEASPIPKEQRTAGFGGVNRYRNLEGFNNLKLKVEKINLRPKIILSSYFLYKLSIALKFEKEVFTFGGRICIFIVFAAFNRVTTLSVLRIG